MRGSAALRMAVAPGGALAGPWVRDELWRRARAVPSLDLRFADNKSLVDATTGQNLVTFTRASSGTYVDSQGVIRTATTNEARFDHDPTTGESLGLLVEEQRQNLLLRSEEFGDASWVKTGLTVTSDSDISPDGQTTADALTVGGSGQSIYQSATVTASTSYTGSAYIKLGTLAAANYKIAVYDNTNAAFIAVEIVPAQTPTSTGWTRISYTFTTPATCTSVRWYPFRNSGNVSGTVLVWGAQLEAGASPTSYIPTTTATATRSADLASITGSNFSSWYRQDEGTVFAQATTNARHAGTNSFPRIASLSDGTTQNRMDLLYRVLASYTDAGYSIVSGNVSQASFDTNNERNGQSMATAYATNNFAFAVGGALANTDNSGTVPTVDRLNLGTRSGVDLPLTGTIRRLCFWPQRLGNEVLQRITQ